MIHLLQAPEALAYLLEAAGAVTLERCGAILDERAAAPKSDILSLGEAVPARMPPARPTPP